MAIPKIIPSFFRKPQQAPVQPSQQPHIQQVQTYNTKLSGVIDNLLLEYENHVDSRVDNNSEKFTICTLTDGTGTRLDYDLTNSTLTKKDWNIFTNLPPKSSEVSQLSQEEMAKVKEGIEAFKAGKLNKENLITIPGVKEAFGRWLGIEPPSQAWASYLPNKQGDVDINNQIGEWSVGYLKNNFHRKDIFRIEKNEGALHTHYAIEGYTLEYDSHVPEAGGCHVAQLTDKEKAQINECVELFKNGELDEARLNIMVSDVLQPIIKNKGEMTIIY